MRIERIYCDICKKELTDGVSYTIRNFAEYYELIELCKDCYIKVDEIIREARKKYEQLLNEKGKKLQDLIY